MKWTGKRILRRAKGSKRWEVTPKGVMGTLTWDNAMIALTDYFDKYAPKITEGEVYSGDYADYMVVTTV